MASRARAVLAGKVGRRVRQLRIRLALTIPELAAAVGGLPHHVARLERGQHVPGLLLLGRVADALGVPVAELLKEPERELSLLDRLNASRAVCERLLQVRERALVAVHTEQENGS